jgi:hypothetical protein
MMPRTHQEASQGAVCLTPWAVICSDGPEPRNPQASYYRARYYDQTAGRFTSEDPIGFNGGSNFYAYVGNSPVRSLDPFGLAHCVFFMNIGMANGAMICYPDNPNDDPISFPANSGNNGDPAHKYQNNSACPPNDHGPLPPGPYRFGGPSQSHSNVGGIHLYPTGPDNQYGADGRFLTHWCVKGWDNQQTPNSRGHFCSEGCIVSSPDSIKALNNLLAKEPGSTLSVIP